MTDVVRLSCVESLLQLSAQEDRLFLVDLSPKDKPWDVHRLQAEDVAGLLAYGLPHHQRKALRMNQCANVLEFGRSLDSFGAFKLKLKTASFCRNRECPVCQWRRALMWVARFYRAFPKIYADHPEWRYVLLTLTVRNCPVSDLRKTVTGMNQAWQRLIQRKTWPALGFVRSLEITRSKDGQAHPHFHCLLAVPPSYFGRNYLSTAKWALLWQECLRVDYTPICDVRIVKPRDYSDMRGHTAWESPEREAFELGLDEVRHAVKDEALDMQRGDSESESIQISVCDYLLSAIVEVIKYTVKPSDMVRDADWLYELSDNLRNLRAVALGGELKKYINEVEPSDLVKAEDTEPAFKNSGGLFFGWREEKRLAKYIKR